MSVLVAAQNQDNCQCAPLGYRFKLNLQSPVCDPGDSIANVFGENSGVEDYTCQSTTLTKVNSAQFIFQLRNATVAAVTKRDLDLNTDDTIDFEYTGPSPAAFNRITLKLFSGPIASATSNTWTIQLSGECGLFALETTAEEKRQLGLAQFVSVYFFCNTDLIFLAIFD